MSCAWHCVTGKAVENESQMLNLFLQAKQRNKNLLTVLRRLDPYTHNQGQNQTPDTAFLWLYVKTYL